MASRKGSEEEEEEGEEEEEEEEEERGVGRSLGPIIENAAGPRHWKRARPKRRSQRWWCSLGGLCERKGLPWPAVRHAIRQKVARAGETVGKTEKKEADDTDGKNETRMRERKREREKGGLGGEKGKPHGGQGTEARRREKEKEPRDGWKKRQTSRDKARWTVMSFVEKADSVWEGKRACRKVEEGRGAGGRDGA